MTETEWQTSDDPTPMLEFLRGKASDRKLRLFACAWCREVWHLLMDERSRKAVEVAERYTDGLTSREELDAMNAAAWDAWKDAGTAAARIAAWDAKEAVASNPAKAAARIAASDIAGAVQSDLLRDIFDNPFRPSSPMPMSIFGWNNGTVYGIAQAIYDDRASDHLPILADALEEAGCTDRNILDHCHQTSVHVRGCWVVDLLLSKQ